MHTHKTQVTCYRTWTRKDARTSALTKAVSLLDAMHTKFLTWSSLNMAQLSVLAFGPARCFCEVEFVDPGNVVINSTVPRRWDTAKQFRPASRWHLKITNTIDPWICHRNLRSWVRSTTEYHSDPQPWPKPKTASKLKPDNWFSAQESNASGWSCMHEANPCAQLYRFKMAADYPGIHGLTPPSLHKHRKDYSPSINSMGSSTCLF